MRLHQSLILNSNVLKNVFKNQWYELLSLIAFTLDLIKEGAKIDGRQT